MVQILLPSNSYYNSNLATLALTIICSDFTFLIKNEEGEDQKIFAHKNILFARAVYFKSMFTSG